MFSEQYRRDNEKLHAKETLLMEIQKQAQAEQRRMKNRARFTRYGLAAAAIVLVLGGALIFTIGRGDKGKTALDAASTGAQSAAVAEAAESAAAPEAAVLDAIAETVKEEAPAANAAQPDDTSTAITTPASYDALYAIMDGMAAENRKRAMVAGGGVMETAVAEDGATMSAAAEPAASADMGGAGGGDYSRTNVQVEGVDEADIVKTDGEYIYYVAGDKLTILRASGAATAQVSQTQLTGDGAWWGFASEMYVSGDRLLLVTQGMTVAKVAGANGTFDDNRDMTEVRVYDIADRAKPTLLTTFAQSGSYVSSRMTGNYVYLVTTHYVWQPVRNAPVTFVPETRVNDVGATLAANDIYIVGDPSNMAYTVVGAVDITDATAFAGVKAVFGNTGELYCSGKNLLLACSVYDENVSDIAPDASGRNVQVTTSRSNTKLSLFSLDGGNIALTATGVVPGTLLNQFAMDEYKGVFRIVTSVSDYTQRIYTDGVDTYEYENRNSNGLYTLDENLSALGSLDNLAPDEWVESVRFDGDIAYFVTFRQTDPLFTVDLSNPKAPKLLSTLKIPGFSEYLHVYGEGLLFGIGYAADETTGGTQGVKLSMFDTSDKKDVRETTTARVDASWTVVGGNHKAILVDPEKNLIAFPADSAYYIYSYGDKTGFTQLAKVTMSEDLYSWNLRGLFIGDSFYVLSDSSLTIVSMSDWKTAAKVSF